MHALSRYSYAGPPPAEVHAPRLGAPYVALTFCNGQVTGIAATARLDRFRSRGVSPSQFGADSWCIPPTVARSRRTLAATLRPMRVTSSAIGRVRYG